MRIIRTAGLVLAVALVAAAMGGVGLAGEAGGAALYKKWVSDDFTLMGGKVSVSFVFSRDGTVAVETTSATGMSRETYGFTVKGRNMYLFPPGEPTDDLDDGMEIAFRIKDNILYLTLDEDDGENELRPAESGSPGDKPKTVAKQEKKTPPPEPRKKTDKPGPMGGAVAAASVAGAWDSGEMPRGDGYRRIGFDFRDDGTVTIATEVNGRKNRTDGTYQVGDADIRITNKAGKKLVLPFSLEDGDLRVVMDGEDIVLSPAE